VTTTYDDIFVAILVGGSGTRLGGVDKALLKWPDGTTLLERLVGALRPAVRDVVLVGRAGQSYPVDCRLLTDTREGSGPLAGLDAALHAEIAPWCFLVACDMPGVGVELLHYLADRRTTDVCAVVPSTEIGLEPTAALYSRACRASIRAALDRGQRAVHKVVESLAHNAVDVPAVLRSQLTNVNTPEDLLAVGLD
jgi:molybdopterin-guanine dinucleotide biosynthesis protein A